MGWPLSQDYNEAIQSPATCLADPELKAGNPATNALGIPQPRSGNFADVYEFHCPAAASRWALKCFTREVRGLRERYAEVSAYLQQARLPFTVEFHYLEQGMRIRGGWYPALKMRWVEGLLLNEFVRDNLDKPARLQALSQIWLRMAKRLREAGMAHADLQHGNVILVPGSTANSLAVKLIDYDGMFVPALAGRKSGEVGHPNYQHPQRLREGTYSAEVDRFPLLVVATALRVLAAPEGRALWQRYDNGDNLLFKETDLRAAGQSPLFQELRQSSDPLMKRLVGALEQGCAGRLENVPLLEELLPEEKPAVRTAIKDPGAVTKTVAAAESPDWDFDREGPAPVRPVRRLGTSVPPWAWAAGGALVATLVVGGILLATRTGPEKTPDVAQQPLTPPPRKRKPAPVKPVVRPPRRPPQLAKQPEDWTTFHSQSLLGEELLARKKYDEAEPLLRNGYEGLKQHQEEIPEADRKLRLVEALERLLLLYEATGKKEEAAKWSQEPLAPSTNWSALEEGQALLVGSRRTGNNTIVLVDPDGKSLKHLTQSHAEYPAWSSDGKSIAFASNRDGVSSIYVMDADGSNVRALTRGDKESWLPSWSADGKILAFSRRGGRGPRICTMAADGSDAKEVADGWDPALSPDGKRILFTAATPGKGFHVYVMDVDGANVKQLTTNDNPYGFVYPSWSPDGRRIAWTDWAHGLNLFVADADGKNARQLTSMGSWNSWSAWSPDGKSIAFLHSNDQKLGSYYIVDVQSGRLQEVLKNQRMPAGGRPAWRPQRRENAVR